MEKFFIFGVYSDLDVPYECFRPTQQNFDSVQNCIEWIEVHKKYFASSLYFGICSIDNSFSL